LKFSLDWDVLAVMQLTIQMKLYYKCKQILIVFDMIYFG